MSEVIEFTEGGYRFVKGMSQYSAAVGAMAGYAIERVRLRHPLAIAAAFDAIADHLHRIGRPIAALCACELRSPAPFSEDGFARFNHTYVSRLEEWGLLRSGFNPVARSNVCPEIGPPMTVSLCAFSYTLPATAADAARDFIVAGSGEAPEGKSNYRDHVIRRGDHSSDGLALKARWVLGEMERRMAALGFDWRDATATQLYTVYDIHPFVAAEIVARGAMERGLSWHFARPPVVDLDYEMDVRGVAREMVV